MYFVIPNNRKNNMELGPLIENAVPGAINISKGL